MPIGSGPTLSISLPSSSRIGPKLKVFPLKRRNVETEELLEAHKLFQLKLFGPPPNTPFGPSEQNRESADPALVKASFEALKCSQIL